MSSVLSIGGVFRDEHWIESADAVKIALSFACLSLVISCIHILRHLKNYSMPQVQLYVIRILFTCPVYAITSSLALSLGKHGIFAEVLRDVYEAVVVYSFMHLILEYCGGETDCVYLMENEPRLQMPFPLCCLKPRARTMRLLRFCQRGVLMFIITQPSVAIISLILLFVGYYYSTVWQIMQTVIYNISYIWALYCLYVFYLAIKQNIKNFRPIAKFVTVKSIIFATYYQSLFLKLVLSEAHLADMWNNLLLCVEMVGFASALMFAFPVSEFQGGIPDRRVLVNVKDVFTVKDILHDVYHNFTPAYGDYALQRSQSEAPARTASRGRVRASSDASTNHNHASSDSSDGHDRATLGASVSNYLEAGRLNGKLGSVAQELTERYRGRSRRMAFNSLLRGTRPIRATLRSNRRYGHANNTDSCEVSDEVEMCEAFLPAEPNQSARDVQSTAEDDVIEIVFDRPSIGRSHEESKESTCDRSHSPHLAPTTSSSSTAQDDAPRLVRVDSTVHFGRLALSLKNTWRSPSSQSSTQQVTTYNSLHCMVHNSNANRVGYTSRAIENSQSSSSLMDCTAIMVSELTPPSDVDSPIEDSHQCDTGHTRPTSQTPSMDAVEVGIDSTPTQQLPAEHEGCEWGDFV